MLKKVDSGNLPNDIELLLVDKQKEVVPIGNNAYEIYPLTTEKYFKLTKALSEYYTLYNEVMSDMQEDNTNVQVYDFVANLLSREEVIDLVKGLLSDMFPEIEDDINLMGIQQLKYLLGVLYKQNFLDQIRNPQTKNMIQEVQKVLGLNLLQ